MIPEMRTFECAPGPFSVLIGLAAADVAAGLRRPLLFAVQGRHCSGYSINRPARIRERTHPASAACAAPAIAKVLARA